MRVNGTIDRLLCLPRPCFLKPFNKPAWKTASLLNLVLANKSGRVEEEVIILLCLFPSATTKIREEAGKEGLRLSCPFHNFSKACKTVSLVIHYMVDPRNSSRSLSWPFGSSTEKGCFRDLKSASVLVLDTGYGQGWCVEYWREIFFPAC